MEGYIAEIRLFSGNFAPRNWAFCEGQQLPINSNHALYSLIGTTYGGDGRTTFALPDLQGRAAVGVGQGSGLQSIRLGQQGGANNVTLSQLEMPSHTHSASGTPNLSVEISANSKSGNSPDPNGKYLAKSVIPVGRTDVEPVNTYSDTQNGQTVKGGSVQGTVNIQISKTGGNKPHTNMQPYTGLHYIICIQGIYPSRS